MTHYRHNHSAEKKKYYVWSSWTVVILHWSIAMNIQWKERTWNMSHTSFNPLEILRFCGIFEYFMKHQEKKILLLFGQRDNAPACWINSHRRGILKGQWPWSLFCCQTTTTPFPTRDTVKRVRAKRGFAISMHQYFRLWKQLRGIWSLIEVWNQRRSSCNHFLAWFCCRSHC
jgi:hypothetical protein